MGTAQHILSGCAPLLHQTTVAAEVVDVRAVEVYFVCTLARWFKCFERTERTFRISAARQRHLFMWVNSCGFQKLCSELTPVWIC